MTFKKILTFLVLLYISIQTGFSNDLKIISETKTAELINDALNDIERKKYTYDKEKEILTPMPEGGFLADSINLIND